VNESRIQNFGSNSFDQPLSTAYCIGFCTDFNFLKFIFPICKIRIAADVPQAEYKSNSSKELFEILR